MKYLLIGILSFVSLSCLLTACQEQTSWQEYYDLAVQSASAKEYEQAVSYYKEAIVSAPKATESYIGLADTYLAMEDLDDALDTLRIGMKKTKDKQLEARMTEVEKMKEPEYLMDYLDMTVDEVAAIWGDDFVFEDGLYMGGSKGFYYEDWRVPIEFFFTDYEETGEDIRQQSIELIDVWETEGITQNYMITDELPFSLTYPQLDDYGLGGELEEAFDLIDGSICFSSLEDELYVAYGWSVEQEKDPYMDTPSCVEIRRTNQDRETGPKRSWQQLYRNCIREYTGEYASELSVDTKVSRDRLRCSLIYLNDDDIPELWITGFLGLETGWLCTVSDGRLQKIEISQYKISYVERGNLLYSTDLAGDGLGSEQILSIEDGQFEVSFHAEYLADYYWKDGEEIYYEDYQRLLSNVFPMDDAITLEYETDGYTYDEIVSELRHSARGEMDWRSLYRSCIDEFMWEISDGYENLNDSMTHSYFHLLYLGSDSIPELWISSGFGYAGGRLYTVIEGEVVFADTNETSISYIERENRLLDSGGRMGFYYDEIYTIYDGQLVNMARGEISDEGGQENSYEWDGQSVSEADYQAGLAEEFDKTKAITLDYGSDGYSYGEIMRFLRWA